ncbi:unnamed protein product [Polarella glacialis]|uniref:Uncharacterized protein n=1 Tax=Polarella glacialis TaxID=89957 RepID=A0A813EGS9_POLGL|nr:unnamed protein product [Polarella glacialis]CAE8723434.1 unnamed protein product [Polarella glacialis]
MNNNDKPVAFRLRLGLKRFTENSFRAAIWGDASRMSYEEVALALVWAMVVGYWILNQVIGCALLWILFSYLGAPLSGTLWDALFLSTSAFHNAGLTTLAHIPVEAAPVLLVLMYLIIAGNTWFPIFLRIVATLVLRSTKDPVRAHALRLLLHDPRHCYTSLPMTSY